MGFIVCSFQLFDIFEIILISLSFFLLDALCGLQEIFHDKNWGLKKNVSLSLPWWSSGSGFMLPLQGA